MKQAFAKLLLMLALSQAWLGLYSQPPSGSDQSVPKINEVGYGQLKGSLIDAVSNEPLPFATIALLDASDEKPVEGTVADDQGDFVIKNIPEGKYLVTISFIGYEKVVKGPYEYDGKGRHVDLGTISLNTKSQELEEIKVEGQQNLITEKVDRMVYNASKDETTKGGDAIDVLRRVPLLSVDLDGNISLRGNQNIKVLIDNRPSTITAGSIGDALKQIPADQIESVEVITSPSARYEAEGTGGIINIITKKNKLQGTSLNINTSGGYRGSSLGLNASYRQGRFGANLGGWGRAGYNIKGSMENSQLVTNPDDSQVLTEQSADTRNNMMFGRYNLGLDYELNKYNWISASARFGMFNFSGLQDGLLTETFQDNNLLNSNTRDVEFDNLSNNIEVNLNYIKTYKQKQKELSILSLYSQNTRTNDFENLIMSEESDAIAERFKNENTSYNREIAVQADYITPIGENQIFEIGAKEIMRLVSSDYQAFRASGQDEPYEPVGGDALSNVFDYSQNILAGYLSYTLDFLEHYSVKAGARYEYATIQANFEDQTEIDLPSYGVLVPSVNLSRKLNKGKMIKAAYNRRIQRPSLRYLNPNIDATNPKNISQGNPNLDPEYTNNYELTYSTFLKGSSLNFSAFMRDTDGSIQSVREVQGSDTLYTTYQNIGESDAYGVSVFANIRLSQKLMLNGGVDSYYAVLDNNVDNPLYNASNEGLVISGRIFGSYNFAENWGFQFFSFMRGRRVQLQGYETGFYMYSLSLQREFKNDRGSIGIGAENFLTPEFKRETQVNTPIIEQSSTNVMRNMNFKINFSYRLGKLDVDPQPRKRKSIENDDLKEGEDDNRQMMIN